MNYEQCKWLMAHLEQCEPKNLLWVSYIRRRGAEVQMFVNRMEEFANKNLASAPGKNLMERANAMQARLNVVLAGCDWGDA